MNTFLCKVWSIIWKCQQKWLIDKGKRNHAISTIRWSYNGLSIHYNLIELSFCPSVCRAPWKASTRSRKFDLNNTTLQNIEVFHFGCSSVYQALNIIYIGKRWLVYAINYWAIGCWNSSFDYWWPSWEGILLPCTFLSDIHMHVNNRCCPWLQSLHYCGYVISTFFIIIIILFSHLFYCALCLQMETYPTLLPAWF